MKSLRPVFAFIASVLGALVLASVARAKGQQPPPPVVVRFLFLEEEFGGYYFRDNQTKTDRKIGDTPYVISDPQAVPFGEAVKLYKDYPDAKTGAPVRTEILSVKPPASAVAALVVVTARPPAAGGDGRPVYQAEFYNSDAAMFPAGSVRVINLGRAELAAKFGKTQVSLSPSQLKVVQPTFDARHRVRTYIGVGSSAGGWQLVYDSITSLRPGQRLTGVLVYSPSGMRHTYRPEDLAVMPPPKPGHFWLTYSDTPPAPAAAKP